MYLNAFSSRTSTEVTRTHTENIKLHTNVLTGAIPKESVELSRLIAKMDRGWTFATVVSTDYKSKVSDHKATNLYNARPTGHDYLDGCCIHTCLSRPAS